MRHVILGTAGHIDHGKSSIVKALTGIDPDRLKEEKERGITIDLGFADLAFPDDDLLIGIVDVPGHERLVKNMLAGAGGIDLVLMVIAADEGIMPQSREHLAICDLLKIRAGLIVITKTDMVEPDWLELVMDEARQFVKGTFLEGAGVVAVSAKTGQNIGMLRERIKDIALLVEPKPTKGLFRLPVDRVFTLKGFGTVVTGTALSGTVRVDEQVEVLPSGLKTKVRGLHSHGKHAEQTYAGQRTAVNLQGVEKDELKRGDMVVTAGRFSTTTALDTRLELLKDSIPVKTRSQVHFHLGTSETVARVILYGTEKLGPGESSYCQFRLNEPVVAQAGDRFVIRRLSPLETLGGGLVLDSSPRRRRRRDGIDDLPLLEKGGIRERIAAKVSNSSVEGMTIHRVEGWLKAEVPDIGEAVRALLKEGVLFRFDDLLLHRDAFELFRGRLTSMLKEFHAHNPTRQGIAKGEARERLKADQHIFSALVEMVDDVAVQRDIISLKGFSAAVSDSDKALIQKYLEGKGIEAPQRKELAAELGIKDKQLADVLKVMAEEGSIKRVNDSFYISMPAYEGMIKVLREHFASNDSMTVAGFRDLMGTTRKYALPVLEFLDASRVTVRVGDVRKLLLK
ncbi:MAG: selenocysteine-specific translation elongation factor [Thermodesulfovibrionales bacterium]|nr:selenocysteine-specific translation elongation factor [Thermodesulfovibrionales bacterium]